MHQRLIRIAPARSPPQNNMIIVREIIEKKMSKVKHPLVLAMYAWLMVQNVKINLP